MAGERTPDTSPDREQGSSDDDISLREHLQRQLDTMERNMLRVMNERQSQLDERYLTQTKALDAAFASAEKAVSAALQAAETAVQKAEMAADKRFEAVNEFRGQLADQAQRFMTRDESLSRHDRTQEQIKDLTERFSTEMSSLRDRHNSDFATTNSRLDLTQGKSTGLDSAWGYIIGAIGLISGVIAIVVAVTN